MINTFGELLRVYTYTGELRSMLILTGMLLIGVLYLIVKYYTLLFLQDKDKKPLSKDTSRQTLLTISSLMGVVVVVTVIYSSYYLQKDLVKVLDDNMYTVMIETFDTTKTVKITVEEITEFKSTNCYNNTGSTCYEVKGQLDGEDIRIYTKDDPYDKQEFNIIDISEEERKHINKLYSYLKITSYITFLGSDIDEVENYRDMLKFSDNKGNWYITQ